METQIKNRIIRDILEQSYQQKLGHIPSALSWFKMLYEIFNTYNTDNIFVFGKFWGSQAVYAVLRELKIADVNHFKDLKFVYNLNYETIGDTLGFACGLALAEKRPIICILSDSVLQSGYTYEAVEFMIQHNLDLRVFVDDNHQGVCGCTDTTLSIEPLKKLLMSYNLYKSLDPNYNNIKNIQSTGFYFYQNIKGDEIPLLQQSVWHYKMLDKETYLKLINEYQ